jgi:hypothetical protein
MLWDGTAIWLTSTSLTGGPYLDKACFLCFLFFELVVALEGRR